MRCGGAKAVWYLSLRWCCAPSQNPWSSFGTVSWKRLKGDAINKRIPASSSHPGTTTTNVSGPPPSRASSASNLMAISSMTSATNGGFASKEPPRARSGVQSQKEPTEPNGASVSRKAEQKEGKKALREEAKHSCVTPSLALSVSWTCGGALWRQKEGKAFVACTGLARDQEEERGHDTCSGHAAWKP